MRISDWSSDVCSSDQPSCSWLATVAMTSFPSPMHSATALKISLSPFLSSCPPMMMRGPCRSVMVHQSLEFLCLQRAARLVRSDEHTSEIQSLMRISYAAFCLKKTIHNESQDHMPHTQKQLH